MLEAGRPRVGLAKSKRLNSDKLSPVSHLNAIPSKAPTVGDDVDEVCEEGIKTEGTWRDL